VHVGGAVLHGLLQDQVDQANHRRLGGQVLEVLDVFLGVWLAVQGLDQRVHGAAALAVEAFDQGVDLGGGGDHQRQRPLGAVTQGVQGVRRQRRAGSHRDVRRLGVKHHQAMVAQETLAAQQRRRGVARQLGQVQARHAQQGCAGLGHLFVTHGAQAHQGAQDVVVAATFGQAQLARPVNVRDFGFSMFGQPLAQFELRGKLHAPGGRYD